MIQVRAFIGEILAFSKNIMVYIGLALFACGRYPDWMSVAPQVVASSRRNLVRECSCLPADYDIMGIRPYEEIQPPDSESDALEPLRRTKRMRGWESALVRGLVATRPTVAIAVLLSSPPSSSSSGSISIARWETCTLAGNQQGKPDKNLIKPKMLVQMFMKTLPL